MISEVNSENMEQAKYRFAMVWGASEFKVVHYRLKDWFMDLIGCAFPTSLSFNSMEAYDEFMRE